MKKKIKIMGILAGIIIIVFVCIFFKFGNREVAIEYNPIDQDYYVKVYQKGFFKDNEYRCIAILYGPDGEISREYFDAMSTDQPVKRHMDDSVIIAWKDEYVSVSVKDPIYSGVTRNFFIDGRITLEDRHWGAGF